MSVVDLVRPFLSTTWVFVLAHMSCHQHCGCMFRGCESQSLTVKMKNVCERTHSGTAEAGGEAREKRKYVHTNHLKSKRHERTITQDLHCASFNPIFRRPAY